MSMFNRRITRRLAESVRQDLQNEANTHINRYQHDIHHEFKPLELEETETTNDLDDSSSNQKKRSKSRIAAGFNPETGQAYQISSEDSNQVQGPPRTRSRSRSSELGRKSGNYQDDEDQQGFVLPSSVDDVRREEFDVDQEIALQYPTQDFLTGENLLEEYSEELNASSANNIRPSQQSQQRISVPMSPQVSKQPFSAMNSIQMEQYSNSNSSVNRPYQRNSVPPLIPSSRTSNSRSASSSVSPQSQSQSKTSPFNFSTEQNARSQLYRAKTFPAMSQPITNTSSKQFSDKQAVRSQKVVPNSAEMSQSLVALESEKQQEQFDVDPDFDYSALDSAGSTLYDESSDPYRAKNISYTNSGIEYPPNTNTVIVNKYDQQSSQQQQQLQVPNLPKPPSTRNNQIPVSLSGLSSRERDLSRTSRRPQRMMGISDQDRVPAPARDREYQYRSRDRDNVNSKLNEEQGAELSYTPSIVSRPNSNFSLTNQTPSQQGNYQYRDVVPLPLEIRDSATDTNAIRRYLSRGSMDRNSMGSVGSRAYSQNGSLNGLSPMPPSGGSQENQPVQQRQSQRQGQGQGQGQSGQPQCYSIHQDVEIRNDKFHKRTASLSHAIMTLALLSASAAQLRFVVAYSHAHSYPTLNYFLICSCIIIEVLVGIGFVVLARFDFSEAFQDKLHSYLIFGLFVVTVANVIVAAFALDDHICDVLMKKSLTNIDPQLQLDNSQLQLNGLGSM